MQYTIILESRTGGGYTARCVENELLHRTISAVGSEIIMIEVADAA